jgi:hypothetical protein
MLTKLIGMLRLAGWLALLGSLFLATAFTLTGDVYHADEFSEKVRAYTRRLEFDFISWTLNALGAKARQASVDEQHFLNNAERAQKVRQFFNLRAQLNQVEAEIARHYADPAVADPAAATANLRIDQANLRAELAALQPLAEAILQEQISVIFAEQGLALGGQVIPPASFHFTPLPLALIVSPRNQIRQATIQMLDGELTLDKQVELEDQVARGLDVSTLVTPVGGIGTYPAMVAQSSDLNWIASVTAHEWAHNYLTLRPLGLLYDASSELRTINETAAVLVGDEIGALIMRHYYPDIAPPPPGLRNFLDRSLAPELDPGRPGFDFNAEMRQTRVNVDKLLAQGQVAEAEGYMEERRQMFWENGYRIRKLNQAYFAFYGAYAAGSSGGGAQGADPVGPAVNLLRRRSANIAEFLSRIAWFTSVQELRAYLGLVN